MSAASGPATLARASDLVGRPVVSIADGLDIAEVKDVVFEPDRHALMGFTLNKRGFWRGSLRELLPTANITAIGPDAVMVDSADALAPPDQAPVELQPGSKRHGVLGTRVMTNGGRSLGVITGVIVSLGSRFEVVGYEIDGPEQTKSSPSRLVPIDAQLALSEDLLLLPDEIEQFIRHDLAGFGSAVEEFRNRPQPAPLLPQTPPAQPTPLGQPAQERFS